MTTIRNSALPNYRSSHWQMPTDLGGCFRLMHQRIEHGLRRLFLPTKNTLPVRATSENSVRLMTTLHAAREIRQLRIQANLTQHEFATLLGVTSPCLTRVEIGEANCLQTLQLSKLARVALRVSGEHSLRNHPSELVCK